jgi:hypothetical protein
MIERIMHALGFSRCVVCGAWMRGQEMVCSDECDKIHNSWMCGCGHYEEGGCCCTRCGGPPPWGCVGCQIGEEAHENEHWEEDYHEHYP